MQGSRVMIQREKQEQQRDVVTRSVCVCLCVCRTGLAGRELGEQGREDEVGWSSGTWSGRAGR